VKFKLEQLKFGRHCCEAKDIYCSGCLFCFLRQRHGGIRRSHYRDYLREKLDICGDFSEKGIGSMHREMVETFIKTPFEEYVAKPICVSGKDPL